MEWSVLAQVDTELVSTESFSLVQIITLLMTIVGAIAGAGWAAFRSAKKNVEKFITPYVLKASNSSLESLNGTLNGVAQHDIQLKTLEALNDIKAHFGIVPEPDPQMKAMITAVVREVIAGEAHSPAPLS